MQKFHNQKAAHRDIKPDNIIISKIDKIIKLADMGLSYFYKEVESDYCVVGSLKYLNEDIINFYNKTLKNESEKAENIVYEMK